MGMCMFSVSPFKPKSKSKSFVYIRFRCSKFIALHAIPFSGKSRNYYLGGQWNLWLLISVLLLYFVCQMTNDRFTFFSTLNSNSVKCLMIVTILWLWSDPLRYVLCASVLFLCYNFILLFFFPLFLLQLKETLCVWTNSHDNATDTLFTSYFMSALCTYFQLLCFVPICL